MTFKTFFIPAVLSLGICSCSVEQKENIPPDRDSAMTLILSKIYNSGQLPSETFAFDSSRDTIYTSKNGTKYHFFGNSFVTVDGSPATGVVDVEIKEALTPGEFVLGNLTTRTYNNEILESGGMIYVNVSEGENHLELAQGSEIGVILSSDSLTPGMSVFEGVQTDSGMVWQNPEPVMNEELKQFERSYTTITYHETPSTEVGTEQWSKVHDWLWVTGRKIGDKGNIDGIELEILNITSDTSRITELADGRFMQEVLTNKGTNDFVSDYNTDYIFSLKKLGWANIDRLFDDPRSEEIDFRVQVDGTDELGYVFTSLIIPEKGMHIVGYQKADSTYSFSHGDSEPMTLPIGEKAFILATCYTKDKTWYSLQEFTITKKIDLNVKLEQIGMADLKKKLETEL